MALFSGGQIAETVARLGYSHIIWLPDSMLGQWESALASDRRFELLRVCREGEAWPLAAGLMLGGRQPLVMMQSTGLFESGDALRNVVYDLGMPITAIVGARSWLNQQSRDTARRFTLPIIQAWQIRHRLIERDDQRDLLQSELKDCLSAQEAGLVLIAEGRM